MMRNLTAILLALLCLVAMPAAATQHFSTFLTNDHLFSDGERATLQRDADLAQRAGVPIMFAVVRGDGTSVGSAQAIADRYREEQSVESEPGADDGIVFLTMWLPATPDKSVVVYSAGSYAFATSGLTPERISAYISEDVLPRLHDGGLFNASVFLMRLTRATSLYVPPPAREIEGIARVVQQILIVVAPVLVASQIVTLGRLGPVVARRRWQIVGGSLVTAIVLTGASVWAHSWIGMASVAISLLVLAGWCVWTTRDAPSEGSQWRSLLPDVLIALLLIAASITINMQRVELTPGDRDETRWLNRAYYAADLIDPFGPTWQDYVITVGQPPLGSVAIGIGLAVQGEDLRGTGVWDYQYDRAWYTATGGYPTEEALYAGRRTNAVIGALAVGAAYVLGRLITNRVGGIAAGVYLAWHPLHIVLSTQALSDQTFALLLLLALIAAWQFAAKPTWTRAIVLGILLGLGGATKLTPLLLAPPLAAFGILRLMTDRTPAGKRAGAMLISQPFIAFFAFVAAYPWLWENPIGRTWRLFSFRSGEMDAQTSAWPNALTDGPLEALARFGYKLTYTHSTSRKAFQQVYDWLGLERTAVGIDLVFAAAGAVILLTIISRRGVWTPHALVAMLMFGEIAILALGMKADFYRYHLPVVMIVSACIAVAVGTGWSTAISLVRRRSLAPSPAIAPKGAV